MNEKVYTNPTINRAGWSRGAWDDEPDKVSWVDEATRLPCLAKRNTFGAWCGYVGVPPEHPLYRVSDFDDADVHGGITYADACQDGPPEQTICHVPEPGESDNVWWFGFDCGHGMDLIPGMEALMPSHLQSLLGMNSTYRTLEYVKNECVKLARQLKMNHKEDPF